jgi:hypothetical protein
MQPTEKQRARIAAEVELVKRLYPAEYAKALTKKGPNRRTTIATLRKAAVEHDKCEPMRAAGRKCGNCRHLDRMYARSPTCSIDGDCWSGYTVVTEDHLCSKHERVF